MPSVLEGKDLVQVPVDKLEPNDWNPNRMSEGKFNELVDEIREDDFDDPLKVVPHPDPKKSDDGYYLIIDGEHRWQAARILGLATVPCAVKDKWEDTTVQQVKTVRRNLLHGDIDKTRFTKLVHRLNETGMALKDMPRALGFESEQAFRDKFIAEQQEKEEGQKQAASNAAKDDERKENSVVQNLSFILNEIFQEYGETVPHGFIFFCHKNKFHLMVQMDDKLEKEIDLAVKYVRESGKNINVFIRRALGLEFDAIKEQEGIDPRKVRAVGSSSDEDAESVVGASSATEDEEDF